MTIRTPYMLYHVYTDGPDNPDVYNVEPTMFMSERPDTQEEIELFSLRCAVAVIRYILDEYPEAAALAWPSPADTIGHSNN